MRSRTFLWCCAAAVLALVAPAAAAARFAPISGTLRFTLIPVRVPPAVSSNVVVVTTTADDVNGDVSSVSALNANPGNDGISLREALLAADATRGSATVYIMFSARLNGKTIEVRSQLPAIHRNHLVIEGVALNGSPARVTLDGRLAPHATLGALLTVQASEVTVRWLRFGAMTPPRDQSGPGEAVLVRPGRDLPPIASSGPPQIANVQIVDDVFDNRATIFPSGIPFTLQALHALVIGTALTQSGGANTDVRGITVARNTFLHYVGNSDAVVVGANVLGASVSGVVIEDNRFDQDAFSIELGDGGNAPRIAGARIVGNTITGGTIGITLDGNAANGIIDDTLIEDNSISGTQMSAINLDAADYIPGYGATGGDVISNTQIVNNVIRADVAGQAGIRLSGADNTSSPPSRVSTVAIENDTLVDSQPGTLFISTPNGPGVSGNQITGVIVRNSIFYEPSGRPVYVTSGPVVTLAPDVLTNSLISGPGWAGSNGNINGTPLFVDEPGGDYHLTAGSPAINAGTTIGAPVYDFDGARRDGQPDIGAFAFGAAPRPMLTVTAEELGGSGTVTSNPAAINCGTACGARFDRNTTIALTATPGSESAFSGWSGGGCSGTGSCTVTMSSAQTVTATFIAVPSITAFKLTNTRFTIGPHATAINARASAAAAAEPRKPRVPQGSAFLYTLSRASTARIVIERQTPGRVVGNKCVAQTKANANKKRCTITTRVGTLTRNSKTGRNTIAFSGRIGRKALAPASYRATITARAGTGPTSKPRSATFTIVHG
jgi:Divergent InlB B-repeat domain